MADCHLRLGEFTALQVFLTGWNAEMMLADQTARAAMSELNDKPRAHPVPMGPESMI